MTTVYVIMGVSGCDKKTVGKALAAALSCPFYDGDDFHSAENVAKMAGGTPLNDDDRAPWLATFVALLASHLARNEAAVLSGWPVPPSNAPIGMCYASIRSMYSSSTCRVISTPFGSVYVCGPVIT